MSDQEQAPLEIKTRLTRSNFCRTFKVDGAWGGVTPQLSIHIALYSERWSVPSETLVTIPRDASSYKDVAVQSPEERVIIREIEADVFLSEDAAIAVRDWLNDRIGAIRERRDEAERLASEAE